MLKKTTPADGDKAKNSESLCSDQKNILNIKHNYVNIKTK